MCNFFICLCTVHYIQDSLAVLVVQQHQAVKHMKNKPLDSEHKAISYPFFSGI